MKHIFTYLLLLITITTNAQEIGGKIVDSSRDGIVNATIQVFQKRIKVGAHTSDYDGFYVIKPLESGTYNVMVTAFGYDTLLIKGVPVMPDGRTTINGKLLKFVCSPNQPSIRVTNYKNPIISPEPLRPDFVDGEPKVKPSNEINDTVISKTHH